MTLPIDKVLFQLADVITRPTAVRKRGDIADAHIEAQELLHDLYQLCREPKAAPKPPGYLELIRTLDCVETVLEERRAHVAQQEIPWIESLLNRVLDTLKEVR